MALEIEHKYLVINDVYKTMAEEVKYISQGYLSRTPERVVRIRICDDKAFITIKGRTLSDTRLEFEYEIPVNDAKQLMQMCVGRIIEKYRYIVPHCGHVWEVDEFKGYREGLVIAEIELSESTHDYELPPFVGKEVTSDPKYFNSNL